METEPLLSRAHIVHGSARREREERRVSSGVERADLPFTSRIFVAHAYCPLKGQRSEPHHVTPLALPNAVRAL